MNIRQKLLLFTAIVLIPAGLSYGVLPGKSLGFLFDVPITNVNGTHMFRAIMGLYLGFAAFWIIGAYKLEVRQAALYSLVVFMLGLAAGRTASLVADGMPSWLLVSFLAVELGIGLFALLVLRKSDD